MPEARPVGAGEGEVGLPESGIVRAVERVEEIDAAKSARGHVRAEFVEEQVLETHAMIVGLDHRQRCLLEDRRAAREDLFLEAVGVEF